MILSLAQIILPLPTKKIGGSKAQYQYLQTLQPSNESTKNLYHHDYQRALKLPKIFKLKSLPITIDLQLPLGEPIFYTPIFNYCFKQIWHNLYLICTSKGLHIAQRSLKTKG